MCLVKCLCSLAGKAKFQVTTTITANRQPLFLAAPCCSAVLLTAGSHLSQNSTKGEFSPEGILMTLDVSDQLGLLPENAL